MPYTQAHKNRSRERIIAASRELFNSRGYLSVSIDEIMKLAGLTRGGFYNHFRDKEDLLLASIRAYDDCSPELEGISFNPDAGPVEAAEQLVEAYLSVQHLEDIGAHCPLVALPADSARAGPRVKEAYRRLLDRMTSVFEAATKNPDTARSLTSLCVGSMLIARTIDDRSHAINVLRSGSTQCRTILAGGHS